MHEIQLFVVGVCGGLHETIIISHFPSFFAQSQKEGAPAFADSAVRKDGTTRDKYGSDATEGLHSRWLITKPCNAEFHTPDISDVEGEDSV